jgi:hypothetical protein
MLKEIPIANACHSQLVIKTYLGVDETLDVSAATIAAPVAVSSLGGGGRVADVPPHHRHRITASASPPSTSPQCITLRHREAWR